MAVDPKMIRAIMDWEGPKSLDDMRSLMGLTHYYRRFIRNFSHIAYPMTSL